MYQVGKAKQIWISAANLTLGWFLSYCKRRHAFQVKYCKNIKRNDNGGTVELNSGSLRSHFRVSQNCSSHSFSPASVQVVSPDGDSCNSLKCRRVQMPVTGKSQRRRKCSAAHAPGGARLGPSSRIHGFYFLPCLRPVPSSQWCFQFVCCVVIQFVLAVLDFELPVQAGLQTFRFISETSMPHRSEDGV